MKLETISKKVKFVLDHEGISGLISKTIHYLPKKIDENEKKRIMSNSFKDVLFINGCDYNSLPHPPRYRIKHQIEQLESNNVTCDEVFYLDLDINLIKSYRVFVFFRTPLNDTIKMFIETAKQLNKTIVYDIDDLVIDTKFTNLIGYVQRLSLEEKESYDEYVKKMQGTLLLCDFALTTTERLASELKNYAPKVYINRNTASEKMIALSEDAYSRTQKDKNRVKIGYFSGSITHNDDFEMIKHTIFEIMEKYQNVELHVFGYLDLINDDNDLGNRIITHEFVDWQNLPYLVSEMDINIAPLVNNIFNEAKSENKWMEAALVRVPTIASNLGAFKRMIKHGKTGLLCTDNSEWYENLERLIVDEDYRISIGVQAYDYCKQNCTTLSTGAKIRKILLEEMKPNIGFVLPALNVSGGMMVALEHCVALKRRGWDVSILNEDYDKRNWFEFGDEKFPVFPLRYTRINGRFDKAVSTMWSTVNFLESYPNIAKRYYLVQNLETDFYLAGDDHRVLANQKYNPLVDVQFLTISKWCQKWLQEQYYQTSRYLPNGIHYSRYQFKKRNLDDKKIKVLIEGDCGVYYKNVDASFKITNTLDRERFEVWYLSYNSKPKDWYKYDKFLNRIPFDEVSSVYKSCDILLKTSILESFSYPPLEMMASGGYVIAVQNEGNKEYLENEKNCLLIENNDVSGGIKAINRIMEDEKLRNTLYINGLITAKKRDWSNIIEDIENFYD